jgi:hypothetical protein
MVMLFFYFGSGEDDLVTLNAIPATPETVVDKGEQEARGAGSAYEAIRKQCWSLRQTLHAISERKYPLWRHQ